MSEPWEDYGPARSKPKAPANKKGKLTPVSEVEGPLCPDCEAPMDEVTQLNDKGSLGWGFAGHAANRLYLMGMERESGMTMRTARLTAYCCPKCRRGEFKY